MAKAPPTWETFRDRSYYDMWAVRMVGERTFGQGIHVMTQAEAEGLCDLLNTTSQVDALRAERDKLAGIVRGWHYLAVGPDEMGDYYTHKQLVKLSEPYASPALKALSEPMP